MTRLVVVVVIVVVVVLKPSTHLLLVVLRSRSVHLPHNMGTSSLVGNESRQVRRLGRIILLLSWGGENRTGEDQRKRLLL